MFRSVMQPRVFNPLLQTASRNFAAAANGALPQLSVVRHPYPINGIPVDQSDSDKFAVIEFSGTQFKVTTVSSC